MVTGVLPEGFKPLIGTEESTLDDKGRVLFSKKKRERLGDDFLVLLGKLNCLIFYPEPVWKQLVKEIMTGPVMDPAREDFSRLTLGIAADDMSFDSQNRVVIPRELRKAANLTEGDRLLIVGCGDRVELWDRDRWIEFRANPEGFRREQREAIEDLYDRIIQRRLYEGAEVAE